MKEYVCTVCGYVHKGELPDDFRCPVCGAGKEAFREVTKDVSAQIKTPSEKADKELSAIEMSVICSNLARGCEKQYMEKEREKFAELAGFFAKEAKKESVHGGLKEIGALISKDIDELFPFANETAKAASDRGALRSLTWSEKVTSMLKYILSRYEKEGEKMLEHTGVYMCGVCGFVYVGDKAPDLCPVCKVPSWKFEKLERRAQ